MIRLAARRLVVALLLLLMVSIGAFALIHAAPGGPVDMYLSNPNVRPEDVARLRRALGLDRPLWLQYVAWLGAFIRGDWGVSFADGRPVVTRIAERVPATLELVGVAWLLALGAAAIGGMRAARAPGSWFDRALTVGAVAGISLPSFWFGLLLQVVVAVGLGWLPSAGRESPGGGDLVDRMSHLVLPALVLALVHAAAWSRYVRGLVREALAQPFTSAARARGIREPVIAWKHAGRAALAPLLTLVLLDAALLVSGAVVTESVFAWPGVGSLFTESIARRDYPVLMAFLMLSTTVVVAMNGLSDLACGAVDPRVRPAS